MKKISFEIETITPMFLAGADQSKAELRAASIKGLLRFWWRALQAEPDLESLKERESKIFGSAGEKSGSGSSFSMRIVYNGDLKRTTANLPKHNITVTSKSRGRSFPVNILEYLAYGPCTYDKKKKRNVIVREYVLHGFRFTIHMTILRTEFISEILKAIYIFDLFGGLGSKSRNGFGSFCIVNREECFDLISNDVAIKNPYAKENLQKFIKRTGSKSYSSFADETKVFRAKEPFSTWDKSLGEVGVIYRGIRSGEKTLNTDGRQKTFEKHFAYDKRQYIGSPIIVDRQEKSFLDRHAKPYFIKIAKEGDKYRAYILYLPSRYCVELNDAAQHDKKFADVCNEFNSFLAENENMETVI